MAGRHRLIVPLLVVSVSWVPFPGVTLVYSCNRLEQSCTNSSTLVKFQSSRTLRSHEPSVAYGALPIARGLVPTWCAAAASCSVHLPIRSQAGKCEGRKVARAASERQRHVFSFAYCTEHGQCLHDRNIIIPHTSSMFKLRISRV